MVASVFGWVNSVSTAVLSAGNSEAFLGVANLQNDQGSPSQAWQTGAGSVTSSLGAWLLIDSGSTLTVWQGFGLFRTNLTTQSTVRWQVGNTLATGRITSPLWDSGTIDAAIKAGYGQTVTIANPVAGRYCSVDINDATNPDGFINIPLAFAGTLWQPASGITYASLYGRNEQTIETVTRGGQEFPVLAWTQRNWQLALDGIRVGEMWTRLNELDRASRSGGNVLFVPDTAGTNITYESIFGRLRVTAPIGFPYAAADRRSWRATISERL